MGNELEDRTIGLFCLFRAGFIGEVGNQQPDGQDREVVDFELTIAAFGHEATIAWSLAN